MSIIHMSKYVPVEALEQSLKESSIIRPAMQRQQHGWMVAATIERLVNEQPPLWVQAVEKALWRDWDKHSRHRDEDSWYQRVYLEVEVEGHREDICVTLPYLPDNITTDNIEDWYIHVLDSDTQIMGMNTLSGEDSLRRRMEMAGLIIAHDSSGYQDRVYSMLLSWADSRD